MNSVNNFSCEFLTKYHMFYLILDYFKTKYKKLNISIFSASISLLEHILARNFIFFSIIISFFIRFGPIYPNKCSYTYIPDDGFTLNNKIYN
jgi:hypothetical protein